jgi:hypothetical protein
MLHDQSLPLYLWVKACATAAYLQNRSPHRILGKMTPEEDFTDRRPDVEHIRIFGCLNFSHVPSERRTKLDPTTQQGNLLGYSEVSKSYRIYIPPLRNKYFEQISDGGLQTHVYTYHHQLEEA